MDDLTLDMVAFGDALVRRREMLGWTRYRLSRSAGMSDPYVRALEQGQGKRVGIEVVVRLARALGTTADDLLRDAGMPIETGLSGELEAVYLALGQAERRAWLRAGEALITLQEEYGALQHSARDEAVIGEPLAAYDRELSQPDEWPVEQP